jgi:hypothetical protein
MTQKVKNKTHKTKGNTMNYHFRKRREHGRITFPSGGENLRARQQQMNKKMRNEASFTTFQRNRRRRMRGRKFSNFCLRRMKKLSR